jgi:hypothetical protein
MVKKSVRKASLKPMLAKELSSWNFVIFLTLALILLVFVVTAINNVTNDVRTRAGLACPEVTLPDTKSCPTGWKYVDNVNGCPGFTCEK